MGYVIDRTPQPGPRTTPGVLVINVLDKECAVVVHLAALQPGRDALVSRASNESPS